MAGKKGSSVDEGLALRWAIRWVGHGLRARAGCAKA